MIIVLGQYYNDAPKTNGQIRVVTALNLSWQFSTSTMILLPSLRPLAYWMELENLKSEIKEFNVSNGIDPSALPKSHDFISKGHSSIAKAIYKSI